MGDTTTLYRIYDAQDRLLYVGISGGSFIRLGQHGDSAAWAHYATKITLERYPTREEAKQAESKAIQSEDPVWNVRGRPIERSLRWAAAYPNGDPDTVDLVALSEWADGLIKRSPKVI